jgi:hypothetical protein
VTRTLAVVAALAALAAPAASPAAPKPDAHDRALAKALDVKVKTFRQIVAKSGSSDSFQKSLDNCPAVKKDPSREFAAAVALLPVALIEIVSDYGPQLRDLRQTLLAMHPHSSLFRRWTASTAGYFDQILQFDNHGQKVDLCEAVTVLLDKKSTAADIHRVLGIDPSLIAKLFQHPASSAPTELAPRMQKFFVAAGLSAKDAKTLTS